MDKIDVLGVGNAIVDIISRCDDGFLEREGLVKGSMALVDEARADSLYAKSAATVETSGGSVANTIAGLAAAGLSCAYLGKVADDAFGRVFRQDLNSLGIRFPSTAAAPGGPSTARCIIHVTPDGERTMSTYLGACSQLTPEDVDADAVAASSYVYLEGYLFDPPHAKAAFRRTAELARATGAKVALSLSDSFCVERHRADFHDFIQRHVDVLFANEQEACALHQTADLGAAVSGLSEHCSVTAVTRGKQGSLVLNDGRVITVEPSLVETVMDSTGAGDQYAAGFLAGLARGAELAACGAMGSRAAAQVIGHLGGR